MSARGAPGLTRAKLNSRSGSQARSLPGCVKTFGAHREGFATSELRLAWGWIGAGLGIVDELSFVLPDCLNGWALQFQRTVRSMDSN